MSRQPIGKGDRVTFILNPAFPKERVISEYFKKSLNRSADIKEVLYNYVISNMLSINDKSMINQCAMNDNSITKEYTMNDNSMVNELSKNDNTIINNDFNINIDNIDDNEIVIELDEKKEAEKADNNALDFLKIDIKKG